MADVTRTDDIAANRALDIKKTRNVAPTKKVVRKKAGSNLRERPSDKDKKKKQNKPPKDHIDVYA